MAVQEAGTVPASVVETKMRRYASVIDKLKKLLEIERRELK